MWRVASARRGVRISFDFEDGSAIKACSKLSITSAVTVELLSCGYSRSEIAASAFSDQTSYALLCLAEAAQRDRSHKHTINHVLIEDTDSRE